MLVGSENGLFASLEDFFEAGVKRPAKQSESPYLRIVVSASPQYFRPDDPDAHGTWDEDRLKAWRKATMAQLRSEHGNDLVFAELHLDEDTPHIHAVVAPTYIKKPRKPGRKKRGETDEEFSARKAAAEAALGVRVVGRASHPELSKKGSFQRLRERMTVALDHLDIEYGEDRYGRADAKTTRQWVKEQAAEIKKKHAELEARERALSKREADLKQHVEAAKKNMNASVDAINQVVQATAKGYLTLHDSRLKLSKKASDDFKAKAKDTISNALQVIDSKLLRGLISRIQSSVNSSSSSDKKLESDKNINDQFSEPKIDSFNEDEGPQM